MRSVSVKKSTISKRLFLYIILFSLIITAIITVIQLYAQYHTDKSELNQRVELINTGYRNSITNAVWMGDKVQLGAILSGIVALPDIKYAQVIISGVVYAKSGQPVISNGLKFSFPLQYQYNNKLLDIGVTHVEVELTGIYANVFQQAWAILGLNAIKTAIVSVCMFFLFYRLVLRRLHAISQYIREFDIGNIDHRIKNLSDNVTHNDDEFSEITDGLNTMQEYLADAIHESFSFKKTLDVSIDSIFMIYPESKNFFYANSGATTLLGYSNQDLLQLSPVDICTDLTKVRLDKLKNFTLNKTDRALHLETYFTTKQGESIPIKMILQYLQIDNDVPRFVLIAKNISERKTIEQAIQTSLDDVQKADESKAKFIASISHELRTPLNAILGFTQILKLDANVLTHCQNESVEEIYMGGKKLLKIIDDLLDFNSITTREMVLSIKEIDPLSLLIDCINRATPVAIMHDITLVNNIEEVSLPAISIDPYRFNQALDNLLSNAIKYNQKGGTVILDCEFLPNKIIRIKVLDTGIGIADQNKLNIFSQFNRLRLESGNIEGVGIGLNITLELIELMGGVLNFESTEGQGSTFWIDLPYLQEDLALPVNLPHKRMGS